MTDTERLQEIRARAAAHTTARKEKLKGFGIAATNGELSEAHLGFEEGAKWGIEAQQREPAYTNGVEFSQAAKDASIHYGNPASRFHFMHGYDAAKREPAVTEIWVEGFCGPACIGQPARLGNICSRELNHQWCKPGLTRPLIHEQPYCTLPIAALAEEKP